MRAIEAPPSHGHRESVMLKEKYQKEIDDIDQKRRTTRYLHLAGRLVRPVEELLPGPA